MNCSDTGGIIRLLRKESGMTQNALAQALGVSDKAVSKWERGLGCPDISILPLISDVLRVDTDMLLKGSLPLNKINGDSMKNINYYVCPICKGISMAENSMEITCCGRRLSPLKPKKAEPDRCLSVEKIENEWYISSVHPMTKDNYIAFVAFLKGDSIHFVKQYPEWNLSLRIPMAGHGKLFWYSLDEGLLYMVI